MGTAHEKPTLTFTTREGITVPTPICRREHRQNTHYIKLIIVYKYICILLNNIQQTSKQQMVKDS